MFDKCPNMTKEYKCKQTEMTYLSTYYMTLKEFLSKDPVGLNGGKLPFSS